MKKLMLFALLCIGSITSYGQAQNLTLTNNTSCDVFYTLYGDVPPACSQTLNTGPTALLLSPGASITLNATTTWPGPLKVFTRMKVYEGNSSIACMAPVGNVQVGACGAVPLSAIIGLKAYIGGACVTSCPGSTVTWTMINPTTGTVVIN
jgi:hypothetical protein